MSTTNTVKIVILVLYALIWARAIVFLAGGLGGREPIPNATTIVFAVMAIGACVMIIRESLIFGRRSP